MYGHGTACAGIVLGLAPEAEIYSVRVLGADLRGKGAAFLTGLEWAVEQGVQAMNLSLSSKSERLFPYFHEIVDQAYFRHVSLVCAVNNVPGLSYPVDLFIGLLGRGPRDRGSRDVLLQPRAAGGVGCVGRRRADRLEGRRLDGRDRQLLRRAAHLRPALRGSCQSIRA